MYSWRKSPTETGEENRGPDVLQLNVLKSFLTKKNISLSHSPGVSALPSVAGVPLLPPGPPPLLQVHGHQPGPVRGHHRLPLSDRLLQRPVGRGQANTGGEAELGGEEVSGGVWSGGPGLLLHLH